MSSITSRKRKRRCYLLFMWRSCSIRYSSCWWKSIMRTVYVSNTFIWWENPSRTIQPYISGTIYWWASLELRTATLDSCSGALNKHWLYLICKKEEGRYSFPHRQEEHWYFNSTCQCGQLKTMVCGDLLRLVQTLPADPIQGEKKTIGDVAEICDYRMLTTVNIWCFLTDPDARNHDGSW